MQEKLEKERNQNKPSSKVFFAGNHCLVYCLCNCTYYILHSYECRQWFPRENKDMCQIRKNAVLAVSKSRNQNPMGMQGCQKAKLYVLSDVHYCQCQRTLTADTTWTIEFFCNFELIPLFSGNWTRQQVNQHPKFIEPSCCKKGQKKSQPRNWFRE